MTGEGGFRDDSAAPDRLDQVVLGHDSLAVPKQIRQQIEDLRPDSDRIGSADEFPPIRIEHVISEDKSHRSMRRVSIRQSVSACQKKVPSKVGNLRDLSRAILP